MVPSKRIFAILGLIFCTISNSWGSNSKDDQRRLVIAEKGGRFAFFLPEAHIGASNQFDRYFEHIVKPAFAASSKFLLERPDDPQTNMEFRHKRCGNEEDSEVTLDGQMNTTIKAHLESTVWSKIPLMEPIENFGRFMRFDALLGIMLTPSPDQIVLAKKKAPKIAPRPATVLMLKTPKPFESVDTSESYFAAYCGLVPAQRIELISALIKAIDQSTQAPTGSDVVSLARGLRATSNLYLTSLRIIQYSVDYAPENWNEALAILSPTQLKFVKQSWSPETTSINAFLIYQRNRTWVGQLPSQMNNERLPFYVLGALHFLDGPYGSGLITMLRENGYKVSLVENRKQLDAILSRLPPPTNAPIETEAEGIERSMGGKCILLPNNYNCTWSDGKNLITASRISPSEESMTVCVQHQSVYGPITNCTGTRISIPKGRKNELLGAAIIQPAAQ